MFGMLSEWSHFPEVLKAFISSPSIWAFTFLGVLIGYTVGVLPGLGPTMGMALSLGIVFRMSPDMGLALLAGILVSAIGTGGITASMTNIPGTAAAAATCMDGYALTKKGRGREAVGVSFLASIIGTVVSMLLILLIQPFVTSIALKFGDWEIFLFCLFGLLICGSLSSENPIKGWIAGMLGLFFAMVGVEGVQSVPRFTFGLHALLTGFGLVPALVGLFGLSEVFFVLREERPLEIIGETGWPIIRLSEFKKNIFNIFRSMLAGIWIGFIPGVGESAACWFSYDLARRASKNKDQFGKGSYEGIIAAEVANNSSSIGALIPALALGVPGSATTAIFLAAMFLMNYRPGPTLLLESPGILCKIAILFWMSAAVLMVVAFTLSRFVITFLSIPRGILMPLVGALCVLGAWGASFTKFSLVTVLFFGVIGCFMKIRNYPVAPMVLGLLIGNITDVHLRRALIQYSVDPLGLITRPFGMLTLILLGVLFYLGIKTNKKSRENKVAKMSLGVHSKSPSENSYN